MAINKGMSKYNVTYVFVNVIKVYIRVQRHTDTHIREKKAEACFLVNGKMQM